MPRGNSKPEGGSGAAGASLADLVAELRNRGDCESTQAKAIVVGETEIKGEVFEVILTTRRRLASLTPREVEVAHLVGHGLGDAGIARVLGISRRTVEKHLQHIFLKWRVHTRAAVARLSTGIVDLRCSR